MINRAIIARREAARRRGEAAPLTEADRAWLGRDPRGSVRGAWLAWQRDALERRRAAMARLRQEAEAAEDARFWARRRQIHALEELNRRAAAAPQFPATPLASPRLYTPTFAPPVPATRARRSTFISMAPASSYGSHL
jgi:hypothetical protein